MVTHELWVVAHPQDGITFALGTSAQSAWMNAVAVRYGVTNTRSDSYSRYRRIMHDDGWRARRCTVTILED